MKIDYLIIGQGLSGSLLAWELVKRQKKVIIVDNAKENASLVAAGLINPVTGMHFVKSTGVEHLLPTALDYYQQLSYYFQQIFYVEKPMLRVLRNEKELLACQKRLLQLDYHAYLAEITSSHSVINAPIGLIEQKKTGYLLTQPLLNTLKSYFISKNIYIKYDLNYDEISLSPYLQWKQIKAKNIIFCEGHHAVKNPWFSWLPFQPVKGEIITANSSQKTINSILNFGQWFIPLDEYQFKMGATFDRKNLNTDSTVEAESTLLSALKQVYPKLVAENIITRQAGIRPTTLDKSPFIGRHPKYKNLIFFNGFGAKGSLQIPWYNQCLVEHLLNNTPIPSSSNILRYYPKP